MKETNVVALTVTYGKRGIFLSQVVDAIIRDKHLARFVIVNNGSQDGEVLQEIAHRYKGVVDIISTEKNIGSAGGFAFGLQYVQKIDCDFVLMLDDDNVLEQDALELYIERYKYLGGECVICGYRPDIQPFSVFQTPASNKVLKKTFFDVWSSEKILFFLQKMFGIKKQTKEKDFFPIIPTRGFVYGGAFLPIEAVRRAPLPDGDLVLYGDDVEYSWGVLEKGYPSYLCARPIIRDVDMSFKDGDHIIGLFDKGTAPFKVYYRIRNMIRISLRNSNQSWFTLHTSIMVWIVGLSILGFITHGFTKNIFLRIWLIFQAVYGGYKTSVQPPRGAQLP